MRNYNRKPPRPAREITCERCGTKFYTKHSGRIKYCIECKVEVYKEHQKDLKKRRNRMIRPDWDTYFIRIAKEVATRSTCPRAAVGAVVVKDNKILATGYNGAPAGESHCTDIGCLMINGHCKRTLHAEANAMSQAVPRGATLYYWDSKGRYAQNIAELSAHCEACGRIATAVGIARVCGRGL